MKRTLNLFSIVFLGLATILYINGKVNPWVILLVLLSQVEFNITFDLGK